MVAYFGRPERIVKTACGQMVSMATGKSTVIIIGSVRDRKNAPFINSISGMVWYLGMLLPGWRCSAL